MAWACHHWRRITTQLLFKLGAFGNRLSHRQNWGRLSRKGPGAARASLSSLYEDGLVGKSHHCEGSMAGCCWKACCVCSGRLLVNPRQAPARALSGMKGRFTFCTLLFISLLALVVQNLFRFWVQQRHCPIVECCCGRDTLLLFYFILFYFLKTKHLWISTQSTALGLGQNYVVTTATAPFPT